MNNARHAAGIRFIEVERLMVMRNESDEMARDVARVLVDHHSLSAEGWG